MRTKLLAELSYTPDIFFPVVFFRQAMICLYQAVGKICGAIAKDPFKFINHRSHFCGCEAGMIKKLNKPMNGLFEVDIILPKGIVCINQKMVAHLVSFYTSATVDNPS